MISLRTRLFVIISLIVLVILAISLFLIMRSKNKVTEATTNTPVAVDSTNFVPQIAAPNVINTDMMATGVTVKKTTTLEAEQNAVKQLARVFAERYNTYSSDNIYNNIKDVEGIVTVGLWKIISVPLNRVSKPAVAFTGSIARVISMDISEWKPDQATVALKLTIDEDKSGTVTTKQREFGVMLLKANDTWLVDKYTWIK